MLGHDSCRELGVFMQSVSKPFFEGCGVASLDFVHSSIRDNGGAEVRHRKDDGL